jgi:hypothetical protein
MSGIKRLLKGHSLSTYAEKQINISNQRPQCPSYTTKIQKANETLSMQLDLSQGCC